MDGDLTDCWWVELAEFGAQQGFWEDAGSSRVVHRIENRPLWAQSLQDVAGFDADAAKLQGFRILFGGATEAVDIPWYGGLQAETVALLELLARQPGMADISANAVLSSRRNPLFSKGAACLMRLEQRRRLSLETHVLSKVPSCRLSRNMYDGRHFVYYNEETKEDCSDDIKKAIATWPTEADPPCKFASASLKPWKPSAAQVAVQCSTDRVSRAADAAGFPPANGSPPAYAAGAETKYNRTCLQNSVETGLGAVDRPKCSQSLQRSDDCVSAAAFNKKAAEAQEPVFLQPVSHLAAPRSGARSYVLAMEAELCHRKLAGMPGHFLAAVMNRDDDGQPAVTIVDRNYSTCRETGPGPVRPEDLGCKYAFAIVTNRPVGHVPESASTAWQGFGNCPARSAAPGKSSEGEACGEATGTAVGSGSGSASGGGSGCVSSALSSCPFKSCGGALYDFGETEVRTVELGGGAAAVTVKKRRCRKCNRVVYPGYAIDNQVSARAGDASRNAKLSTGLMEFADTAKRPQLLCLNSAMAISSDLLQFAREVRFFAGASVAALTKSLIAVGASTGAANDFERLLGGMMNAMDAAAASKALSLDLEFHIGLEPSEEDTARMWTAYEKKIASLLEERGISVTAMTTDGNAKLTGRLRPEELAGASGAPGKTGRKKHLKGRALLEESPEFAEQQGAHGRGVLLTAASAPPQAAGVILAVKRLGVENEGKKGVLDEWRRLRQQHRQAVYCSWDLAAQVARRDEQELEEAASGLACVVLVEYLHGFEQKDSRNNILCNPELAYVFAREQINTVLVERIFSVLRRHCIWLSTSAAGSLESNLCWICLRLSAAVLEGE